MTDYIANSENTKVSYFESVESLSKVVAEKIKKLSESAKHIYIALSGGKTPNAIFDFLALNYSEKINWNNLRFFWVDERLVPHNNEESNYGQALKHLFKKTLKDKKILFPVNILNDAEESAIEYERIISENVPPEMDIPSFDLVLLGMGTDGHTASIFQDSIRLLNSDRLVEVSKHPVSGQQRITFTGKLINNSQEIIFIITGNEKKESLEMILKKKPKAEQLPAFHIKAKNSLSWFIAP